MDFLFAHTNINVMDMEKSLAFYEKALGLKEIKRHEAPDGSYLLVFLTDPEGKYQLELTWLQDRKTPYDLSDNEIHIAFVTADQDAAYAMHQEMGVVCQPRDGRGLYFIEDPDGYWLEILPH